MSLSPEDKDFMVEARRCLVMLVGLIERYADIPPAPPRWCAGCEACERQNRHQNDVRYASRKREGIGRPGVN